MPRLDSTEGSAQASGVAVSSARIWIMRLVAMLLVPALFLCALELGLRLAGYGYSTRFFEFKRAEGEVFHYTNHKFGYRFFPPAVARSPIPQRFEVEKGEDTYRIFLFGESAANGDPEPAYGVGRHLEMMLEERFPETDFEVICTAITAINSHAILPIAREAAGLDGDLWIVYMGNNEMVGPYGASTVFGSKAPPLSVVRATLALKSTRLGQLVSNMTQRGGGDAETPGSWGGISMFSENLLGVDAPERLQVYENFEGNLKDILKAGKKANVPIVLSTVASNLLHCAPFASVNSKALTPEELATWTTHFEEGKLMEASGTFEEALTAYAAAATIDASHAELQYRRGLVYGKMDDFENARELLTLARDLDALAVRADARLNQIIEEISGDYPGSVLYTDAMGLFSQDSFAGLPGRDLFYEHVHLTLAGNYKLARIFADQVESVLPEKMREKGRSSWAGARLIQRRLAVTLWDQRRVWEEMKQRLGTPPYNSRVGYSAAIAYAQEQANQFGERVNIRLDRKVYEEALAVMPEDYLLRARYGSFLSNTGALEAAIIHLTWICEVFPDFEGGFQELGIAQFLAEDYSGARESFERVLELRPDYENAVKALELMDSDPRYSGAT